MPNTALSADADRILSVLRERDGAETTVRLTNGMACSVFNIAWGQDISDTELHITTNISPSVGEAVNFFFTNEIVEILDPISGRILFGRHLTSA